MATSLRQSVLSEVRSLTGLVSQKVGDDGEKDGYDEHGERRTKLHEVRELVRCAAYLIQRKTDWKHQCPQTQEHHCSGENTTEEAVQCTASAATT